MHGRPGSIYSTAALAALLAVSAQAGTVLETVNRDLDGGGGQTTVMSYAQDGQLRVDAGNRDGYTVFRDEALYVMNTQDKTYVVMDRATLKKMADAISPVMKMLSQMPPEQRAQMERMMGNNAPGMQPAAKKEVRKTARTGEAAGYACSYVEILADGTLEDEMCVVPANKIKGGEELMAAAQKMGAMLQEAMKDIDLPQVRKMLDEQAALYAQVGGIPVLSRHFSGGKPVSETTLKSARSEALPASTFAIPDGYTRRDVLQGR